MPELHGVLFTALQREIEAMLRVKVEQPDYNLKTRQLVLVSVLQKLLFSIQ
jgi:hypothetical protein